MKNLQSILIFLMVILPMVLMGVGSLQAANKGSEIQRLWKFDDIFVGRIPYGWMVEGTNQKGPLATWKVVLDKTAPPAGKVLALVAPNHKSSGTYNICWTKEKVFRDGILEVKVKADSGEQDQGGGLIWRVKDAQNYYVARYNPLEQNFRLYFVKNGRRHQLADAANISIKTGKWFTLKITHYGDKIEGWLNGQKYWETTDKTFVEAGGIGVWTKADAASSFDDLILQAGTLK